MAALNAAEAENILQATTKRLRRRNNPKRRWLTDDLIRKVHREMFGEVWEWAGQYRGVELNIGVKPFQIAEEIQKLCGDVEFWDAATKNPLPVLERACRAHHRLAWIHPFRNGNGRHARLISDMYLRAHNLPLPIWPNSEITRDGGARDEYLKALRAGDRHDFAPLVKLLGKFCIGPSGP